MQAIKLSEFLSASNFLRPSLGREDIRPRDLFNARKGIGVYGSFAAAKCSLV